MGGNTRSKDSKKRAQRYKNEVAQAKKIEEKRRIEAFQELIRKAQEKQQKHETTNVETPQIDIDAEDIIPMEVNHVETPIDVNPEIVIDEPQQ